MAKPANKATAVWVVKRLQEAGFEGLFAGGSVRDMLLGVRSKDYDVATNATPKQVKRLFGHVLLIGAKFGVAMVIHREQTVEVTTFRSDISYSDHRRPDRVQFTSIDQDAQRRDFTINGMFYDPLTEKLIDTVGGSNDLNRRIVRTIGEPDLRFSEDYLRMIRAVRFAMRLGFRIAPATAAAIRRHAPKIVSISGERIFDELSGMFCLDSAPRAMQKLHTLGLMREILPELLDRPNLWKAALRRVTLVAGKKDANLVFGAMLADLPVEAIRKIVSHWGASNNLRTELCFYSQHLGDWRSAADLPLCDFKRLVGKSHFAKIKLLWSIDERRLTRRDTQTRRIAARAGRIPKNRISPKPFLDGADLIAMGLPSGPRLGRIIKALYNAQLNEEITSRRAATAMARRLIDR